MSPCRASPKGGNVALVQRGVAGVRVMALDLGEWPMAAVLVRAMHAVRGVHPGAERLMLQCVFLGWDSAPGCERLSRRTGQRS